MQCILRPAVAVLALASSAFAQTSTLCNPMVSDKCPNNTALGTTASFNWTKTSIDSSIWNTTLGTIKYDTDGAQFSIAQQHDAPTIQSLFYLFWGRVSIIMKAAPGKGIVSSVVLESDDLDEIDLEWIGGNTTHFQTNFFGKGDTTTYDRSMWHEVDNTLAEHNYTVVWTQPSIEWYVDGQLIRNLSYDDPLAITKNKSIANPQTGDMYPQTPMNIRIGNWAGGDSELNKPDVVTWAGGDVDYSKGPFVQVVTAIEVEDYTKNAKTYTYSDKSGTFESIKYATGNSTVANILAKPHGVQKHWSDLPKGVRIGIIAGVISVAAIILIGLVFCCIKSRRAGRKERAIADAEWERNLTELQRYKRMMASEEEIHPRAGYI